MASVMFVVPGLGRGGAERVISRLSRGLRNNDVTVVTFDGSERAYEFGGDVIDLMLPARRNLISKLLQRRSRIRQLRTLLDELKPDHAIGFCAAANLALISAASRADHRPLVTVSIRCNPFVAPPYYQRWFLSSQYPKADRIVFQTRSLREVASGKWRLPPSQSCVIPNPLDPQTLQLSSPAPVRESNHIISVGRLSAEKGHEVQIRALSRVPQSLNANLTIFGEGELREELLALARELGVGSRVRLPGGVGDVTKELDRCSVFSMASYHEGFPNALAEAMARGCACVASNCDFGPKDMINDNRSGFLVPVGDPEALANAWTLLLRDHALACQFGTAARKTAQQWNLDVVGNRWLQNPNNGGGR